MADRADYLARTVIARLANLQKAFAEDGRGEPDRRQRISEIEKILAVELGITDGATSATIEAAAPNLTAARQSPDREAGAFAEFLRARLGRRLTDE